MSNGIVTIDDIDRRIERIHESQRDRAMRIIDCEVEDTDCFLSMKAEEMSLRELEAQRRIIENGGMAEFFAYETLDGTPVDAKWIDTRYGYRLRANMPDGSTVWTSATTEKGLAKRGLVEKKVMKPAWTRIGGKGLWNWTIEIYEAKLNRATGEYTE